MKKETIAIFGGSFDPPHIGHIDIVKKSLKILDIDKLIIIPSFLNPFKKSSFFKPKTRLFLSKQAFKNIKNTEINEFEINSKKPIESYKTVEYLQKKYIIKYFIIGSDNLLLLRKWKNFEWLNSSFIWVIATRKNYNMDISFLKKYKILNINQNISSTDIRKNIGIKYHI